MQNTPRLTAVHQQSPHATLPNTSPDDHIVLWRLHGAEHELVCTTIITSFGFALHLALAGEPILLELQRTVDQVTAKAARIEASALIQRTSRSSR